MISFEAYKIGSQYITLIGMIPFVLYLFTLSATVWLIDQDKNRKAYLVINEIHTVLRSILLIIVGFYIIQFMILFMFDADTYLKSHPGANSTDYFRYIIRMDLKQ